MRQRNIVSILTATKQQQRLKQQNNETFGDELSALLFSLFVNDAMQHFQKR